MLKHNFRLFAMLMSLTRLNIIQLVVRPRSLQSNQHSAEKAMREALLTVASRV